MSARILLSTLAAACIAALAVPALGQVPALVNGNFETPDPAFSFVPQGFRFYNFTNYRSLGDAGTPVTVTHSGIRSVILNGGQGRPNGEFEGVQAEEYLDQSNPGFGPRNWPEYTFNPPTGRSLVVSCWFNIAAADAMVVSQFGMKVCLLRNAPGDFSCFQTFEWLDVDPRAATVYPGTFQSTRTGPFGPAGETKTLPSIHTNGQWVKFQKVIKQSDLCQDFGGQCPLPPTNPAYASFFALRFDFPSNLPCGGAGEPTCIRDRSYGAVFVDDMSFKQGCPADFNGSGAVSVQDIFDFLSAYFQHLPSADFNGSGTVTVQDIFDFLSAYFTPCS